MDKLERLDIYLKNNFNLTRSRARLLILEGYVTINDEVVNDLSYKIKKEDIVKWSDYKYVSRAGYKLEYTFNKINNNDTSELSLTIEKSKDVKAKNTDRKVLTVQDKICLDIGSSTGGFTDYLLQNGAKEVYSVDVGEMQFSSNLLEKYKDRIKLFENTDIRNFAKEKKYEKFFDVIVCDVSFISIALIVDAIKNCMKDDGFGIILIKPQFEVGKGNTVKGIVKDLKLREDAINARIEDFQKAGFEIVDSFESGVVGGDGNVEYIMVIKKRD